MDRSLAKLSLAIVISSALCLSLPICEGYVLAATLSAKDTARVKQARQFYKEGQYEDAAKIFSSLSIDYPDKLVFTRNLGACFYYLRRPEPAISNLNEYLKRSGDILEDDRSEVEGWIAEMVKLRDKNAAALDTTPVTVPALPSSATPVQPPTTAAPQPSGPLPPEATDPFQTAASSSPKAAQEISKPTITNAPVGIVGNSSLPQPLVIPADHPQTESVDPSSNPTSVPRGGPRHPPKSHVHKNVVTQVTPMNTPTPENTESSGMPLMVVGSLLTLGGFASLGMGVYYAVQTKQYGDKVSTAPKFNPADEQAGKDAHRLQLIYGGVGVGAAVMGIVLYSIGSWQQGSHRSAISLVPQIGPQSAMIAATGGF
jgi:hypothetical protein